MTTQRPPSVRGRGEPENYSLAKRVTLVRIPKVEGEIEKPRSDTEGQNGAIRVRGNDDGPEPGVGRKPGWSAVSGEQLSDGCCSGCCAPCRPAGDLTEHTCGNMP